MLNSFLEESTFGPVRITHHSTEYCLMSHIMCKPPIDTTEKDKGCHYGDTMWWSLHEITVNDKSFEGEKFRGFLGSSGMRGKVSRFFPSPPSYIHGFQTATSFSTKASHSSCEFSLKLSSACSEMDESTLLTRVCRFHAFQDDHVVTGRDSGELQLKWVRDKTDC